MSAGSRRWRRSRGRPPGRRGRFRVGDGREPGGSGWRPPGPREVAAGLEGRTRLGRGDVQRPVGRQLTAEVGDGRRIGRCTCSAGAPIGAALLRRRTRGTDSEPPIPASSSVVDPRRERRALGGVDSSPADMSATTDSQPRRSAISVGQSRQSVWSRPTGPPQSRATRSARAGGRFGEGSEPIGGVVEDHAVLLPVSTGARTASPRRSRGRDRCRCLAGPCRRQPVLVPTRPARPSQRR